MPAVLQMGSVFTLEILSARAPSGSADHHLRPLVLTGDCRQQLLDERRTIIGVGQHNGSSPDFGEGNHEATVSCVTTAMAVTFGFTRSGDAKAESAAPGDSS